MASFRKTSTGRWQATVRFLDGSRRSRTWPRRSDARDWAQVVEAEAPQPTRPGATVTWRPDGFNMHIHIPGELVTMDMAHRLEATVADLLQDS